MDRAALIAICAAIMSRDTKGTDAALVVDRATHIVNLAQKQVHSETWETGKAGARANVVREFVLADGVET